MTGAPARVWDLAIVGAGPAGASAALGALAADPGLHVLLLDRADFPRDKSCGDGIAPHVVDALAEIGVHGLTAGWEPVVALDLVRGTTAASGAMARPAWVIPRATFDARLVERAVAAGASLRRHRVREVVPDRAAVVLDGRFRARVVVGADGAHSRVRTGLGRTGGRRALAIRGYSPTPPARRGRQVIVYGDRSHPSYAWSFDRGDGLSNVGYGELVTDGAEPPTRAVLLEQLERLLPGSTADGRSWRGHHLPLSGWRWSQPDGPVLLAGDAAGLVNPLSGEGIYYAVATGIRAGRAAAAAVRAGSPGAAGAAYRSQVRALLGRHLRHTATASRLSRMPRVVDAGIRGAGRDPRVFDDLVEIGLGRGLITPRLLGSLARGLVTPPTVVPGGAHRAPNQHQEQVVR